MFACCVDRDIWCLEVLGFQILVPLGQRQEQILPKVMAKVVKRKDVDHRLWKGEEPGVVEAGKRGGRAFSYLKELRYPESVNIWLCIFEMFFKK